jgi:hypothetical protein
LAVGTITYRVLGDQAVHSSRRHWFSWFTWESSSSFSNGSSVTFGPTGGIEYALLWWILYVAFLFRGGGRYSMDQYLTKQFEILAQSDSLGETRRGPCPGAHSRFWLAIASRSTLGILDERSDLLIITQD